MSKKRGSGSLPEEDSTTTSMATTTFTKGDDGEEEIALPGFRFHPTDEELVGFYLRRKVDKRPLRIELIKQVDIYKYDPWDLPKPSGVGDKEGYFFCKRGRKYRNSIRPNRVTGSGFWKATGIDKPVYSHGGEGRDCIGLKKTLVYYRGSAGKGTKTDWMMHEFRLPTTDSTTTITTNIASSKVSTQEAEVWTLCRIFKRNVSHRKYTPDWREISCKRQQQAVNNMDTSSVTCSVDSNYPRENYLSFGAPRAAAAVVNIQYNHEKKPVIVDHERINQQQQRSCISDQQQQPPSMASSSSNINNILSPYGSDFFGYGDWDELRSVVEFAFDHDHPSHHLM